MNLTGASFQGREHSGFMFDKVRYRRFLYILGLLCVCNKQDIIDPQHETLVVSCEKTIDSSLALVSNIHVLMANEITKECPDTIGIWNV